MESIRESKQVGSDAPQLPVRWRRAIVLLALVALSLPIVIAVFDHADQLDHAVGDQAIIQLHAQDIPAQLPLVGAYSRLGFHHPGPMLHYLASPAVHLLGSFGLVLTAAAVAIASVAGLLIVFLRRGGPLLFALGAVLVAVLIRSMGLDLLSMWNPYVLILPFALAIALAWSVWCRDWWALPWLALVATFVAQAHLGLAPAIGVLFVTAVTRVLVDEIESRRSDAVVGQRPSGVDRPPRGPLLISSAILLVTWAPPLLDQLTGDPGNITKILESASSTENGQRLGVQRALGLLGLLLGRVDPMRLNSTADLRILRSLDDGSIWWILVPIAAVVVTAVIARRSRLVDQQRLSAVLMALLVATVVALSTITGLPYLYLERWVVVIGAFIWLDLIWTLLSVVAERFDVRPLIDRRERGRSIVVVAVCGSFLLALGLLPLSSTPGSTNDIVGSAAVGHLIIPVRAAIADCGLVGVAPTGDPEGLLVASGVLAQLERDGFDVGIDDLFAFSHGARHSLRGRVAQCTVLVGPDSPDAPEPQYAELVAPPSRPGGIGVWLVR